MLQNPNVCRAGHRCVPDSIEDVIACTGLHSSVPAKAHADALGMSRGHFYAACDPARSDVNLSPARLLALMRVSRNIAPLRFLAAELGCAIVELPTVLGTDDDVFRALAAVVQEVGEDAAELQRACADGRVTEDELRRFNHEIDDSIEALLRLKALMAARVERPAPVRMSLPERRQAVSA